MSPHQSVQPNMDVSGCSSMTKAKEPIWRWLLLSASSTFTFAFGREESGIIRKSREESRIAAAECVFCVKSAEDP